MRTIKWYTDRTKPKFRSLPDITEEEFTLSPIEKRNNRKAVDELESLLLEKVNDEKMKKISQ